MSQEFKIDKSMRDSDKAFVIAEIGNNHQGSLELAKEMVMAAKYAGADAVKFQTRHNKTLFTKPAFDQPYDNKNSYGDTYGLHREAVELKRDDYVELIRFANAQNIMLFSTPFDFNSLEFLAGLDMPAYKVASADLVNTPMLKRIAELQKPIFLSTGGGTMKDVRRAVDTILPINPQLSVFHCTAAYPAEIKDMNLNVIPVLLQEYPEITIGLSDHENGIDAASVAYMLGARVFEKHFTLNRAAKGTDQSFSLEPEGLKKLVRNLRRIPEMLGSSDKHMLESEKKPLKKMVKSIVAARELPEGHKITDKDVTLRCPSGGLLPYELDNVIGKTLTTNLKEDDWVLFENLK